MRLTESKRSEILAKLLKRKFELAEAKLEEAREEIALAVYNDVFSESDREKMAALPEGWLPEISYLQVQFGHSYQSLHLPSNVRVPCSRRSSALKVYESRHRLAQRWQSVHASAEKLRDEKDALRAQLLAILHSVSTENKLVEVWPEAKPFLTTDGAPKANLPAVDIRALNKALGLPDKAKAA